MLTRPSNRYRKIFERLLPSDDVKRDQVSRVFQLLTYGKRPLKKFEIRDAVTLRADVAYLNDNNRVRDSIFDLCKPLVEIAPDDTVRFIHGSVKEFVAFPSFERHADIEPVIC